MSDSGLNRCRAAVAYLKVALPASGPAQTLAADDTPVLTELGDGLLVTYVVDHPAVLEYVLRRHLVQAGWTEEQLHHRALQNLAAMAQTRELRVQGYGAIHAVLFGGNFEASLLLLDELWDQHLASLAPNGFLAAIPSRDILAFCDADSEAGRVELRQLIERVEGLDHPLTPVLYRRMPATRRWRAERH